MPIFTAGSEPGHWVPTALAAGPFAGLQGGAVAGLVVGEIEAMAQARGWGEAVSASAWFLKPVPMAPLRSETTVLRAGGRVSMVDGTLWPVGEEEPCATVRVTLVRDRPIELPPVPSVPSLVVDPSVYPVVSRRAGMPRASAASTMAAVLGPRHTRSARARSLLSSPCTS